MIGDDIHAFARQLWPLNRSLTGEGVRQTLSLIRSHLPNLQTHRVPSGTAVFDWEVPKEWAVKTAYILCPDGKKICDFSENNLHLLGYSTPVDCSLSLEALQPHLYSLPEQPTAIPYVTSYYQPRWGFCLSQQQRDSLVEGDYRVVIDSTLFDGELNYGEIVIPGSCDREVLLSTYVCHPSMANNELSGPTVTTFLAKWLLAQPQLRHTYRIVFIPETIGAITYLSRNLDNLQAKVIAGFNISCVGDDRCYSFLPSRLGNSLSDRVATHVLRWVDPDFMRYTWRDRGSDERQYCAPGVDLPMASIMRSKYGEYPEYHTSLDNLTDVVTPQGLQGGYEVLQKALEAIEHHVIPKIKVLCEPQLGKRGLYPTLSTKSSAKKVETMMNFISCCDGDHSLLDIAESIEVPVWELYALCHTLEAQDLLEIRPVT